MIIQRKQENAIDAMKIRYVVITNGVSIDGFKISLRIMIIIKIHIRWNKQALKNQQNIVIISIPYVNDDFLKFFKFYKIYYFYLLFQNYYFLVLFFQLLVF